MDVVDRIDILVSEGIYKKVVRGGKVMKKLICQPGFKAVGSKCVRMSAGEIRKRSLSSIKAQKKLQANKTKLNKMQRKKMKSMKKRNLKIPDVFSGGTVDPMSLGEKCK